MSSPLFVVHETVKENEEPTPNQSLTYEVE